MAGKPYQSLAIIEHVDYRKSTLISRLLFKIGNVPEHIIEQHREEAASKGKSDFGSAYVTDNLAEGRKHGATIDITRQHFDTEKYYFTIADAPDHRDLVRSVIMDVSQADHAVLVVAADNGATPQTRKRIFLVRTLGIEEFTIAVNKMDTVNYSEDSYEQVKGEVQQLPQQVQFNSDNVGFIPIPAFESDNITESLKNMMWSDGLAILESLNNLPEPLPLADAPLRVPVQDMYAIFGIGTVLAGRVETGMLETGDNVRFMPSDASGKVKTIEMYHKGVPEAGPGNNVGSSARDADKDDIRHDNVCGPADDPPSVARTFAVQIVAMQHPSAIAAGYTSVIHAHITQVACTFESLDRKLDPAPSEVTGREPGFVKADNAIIVMLRPQKPLSIESSSEITELGSFAIRDMEQTVVVGKVLGVSE